MNLKKKLHPHFGLGVIVLQIFNLNCGPKTPPSNPLPQDSNQAVKLYLISMYKIPSSRLDIQQLDQSILSELKPLAEQGVPEAQYYFGLMMYQSENNLNEAKNWLEKAGKGNIDWAWYQLGRIYKEWSKKNNSQEPDQEKIEKAKEQFQVAASLDIGEGFYEWGLIEYEKINQLKKNQQNSSQIKTCIDKAIEYFEAAVEREIVEAQYYLGLCLKEFKITKENLKTPREYFEEAAQKGIGEASYELALFFKEESENNVSWLSWYKRFFFSKGETNQELESYESHLLDASEKNVVKANQELCHFYFKRAHLADKKLKTDLFLKFSQLSFDYGERTIQADPSLAEGLGKTRYHEAEEITENEKLLQTANECYKHAACYFEYAINKAEATFDKRCYYMLARCCYMLGRMHYHDYCQPSASTKKQEHKKFSSNYFEKFSKYSAITQQNLQLFTKKDWIKNQIERMEQTVTHYTNKLKAE